VGTGETDEEPEEEDPASVPMGPGSESSPKWWPLTAVKTLIAILRGDDPGPLFRVLRL
jgi:hypothetical protein